MSPEFVLTGVGWGILLMETQVDGGGVGREEK